MNRKILYYAYLIALIFLLVSVSKWDLVSIQSINFDWLLLAVSLLSLFLGFAMNIFGWYRSLSMSFNGITFSDATVSFGLSVFLKYIPGKVWILLGRAEWISLNKDLPRSKAVELSTINQILVLFSGLLLAGWVVESLKESIFHNLIVPYLITLIVLAVILFGKLDKLIIALIARIGLPPLYSGLSSRRKLELVLIYLINWMLWSSGFSLLLKSIGIDISILDGSIFAFATTAGIIAVFAPGGLGVREIIIGICLASYGVSKEMGITVSILSRLWFLIAEVSLFLVALVISRVKSSIHDNSHKQ